MPGNSLTHDGGGRPFMAFICVCVCALSATTFMLLEPVRAQAQQTGASVEDEVTGLLEGEEFLGRKTLIAKGPPILPVLLKLFGDGASDRHLIRIMAVLGDIGGSKAPFIPKIAALARTAKPNVQTAALLALTQIGGSEHAGVFEEIVADTRQRNSARILAARGLEKLGTAASLKLITTLLPLERARAAHPELLTALETAQGALQKRFQ